jgi:hypothetical protein
MRPAQLKHSTSGSAMSQRPPPSLLAQTVCSHTAPRRYTSAAFDTESTLMFSRMLTEFEPVTWSRQLSGRHYRPLPNSISGGVHLERRSLGGLRRSLARTQPLCRRRERVVGPSLRSRRNPGEVLLRMRCNNVVLSSGAAVRVGLTSQAPGGR